jgi:hypothetical protein
VDEESQDATTARSLALQRIGRNVLDFHTMETMLKELLVMTDLTAPPALIPSLIERRQKELSRKSLGQLFADDKKGGLFADLREPVNFPGLLREDCVTFSVAIESTAEGIEDWRKYHKAVSEARNDLIHNMLGRFDVSVKEDCDRLSEELDRQHERIFPAFEQLASVVKHARTEFARFLLDLENGAHGKAVSIKLSGST